MGEDLDSSDESLWPRVVAGDGEAFGVVFDRHRDRILGHALRLVRPPHVAEDVTAMVFYEAWRRRADVRIVNGSVVAWLLMTTNYTVRNQARQQRRYQQFLAQLPPPAVTSDIADDVAETEHREIASNTMRAAFAQLRPQDRDILTLCVLEELSVREAADALEIAEGTVKSRLYRAKAKLRGLYVTEEDAPDSLDLSATGRTAP